MRIIVDYLCYSTSGYARMTISHSIVAPRVPWDVKNEPLMQIVPDPSSLSEGAGTQIIWEVTRMLLFTITWVELANGRGSPIIYRDTCIMVYSDTHLEAGGVPRELVWSVMLSQPLINPHHKM